MQKIIDAEVNAPVPVGNIYVRAGCAALATVGFALAVAEICTTAGIGFVTTQAITAAATYVMQETLARTSLFNTENGPRTPPASISRTIARGTVLAAGALIVGNAAADIASIPSFYLERCVTVCESFFSNKLFRLGMGAGIMTFAAMAIRNHVPRRIKASELTSKNG